MPIGQLALLGVVAGFTIFLGLPIGRRTRRSSGRIALLNALTIGVLVFLPWDILSHAVESVEGHFLAASQGDGPGCRFPVLVGLTAGFATDFVISAAGI